MMPGVVAGFPRKAGITMNSGTDGMFYGYYTEGYTTYPFGSLAPPGATVIPGGAPSPGGRGEILDWFWHGNNHWVILRFRGPYANLAAIPFNIAEINGAQFSKASAGVTGYGTDTIRMEWQHPPPNPMPVGILMGRFS